VQSLELKPYMVTLKRGLKLAKVLDFGHITSIQKCESDGTDNIPLESEITRQDLDNFHKSNAPFAAVVAGM